LPQAATLVPAARLVQLPGVAEQVWQAPVHEELQQTDPTQKPLMQSLAAPQVLPSIVLHAPPVVQAFDPLQVSSVPLVSVLHVPPLPQRWQVPLQAFTQQTLSTQKFDVHWLAPVQLAPFACLGLHCPTLVSQYWPDWHCVSLAQLPRQPVPVLLQV
jgi:hypothetical protein